ncbi:Tetratricopeptide-like helical domain superfamily [Sesbania bispinosa]|nr:Tetratricopeptide-like helical domain superfamily [Sesbania bispinosa]
MGYPSDIHTYGVLINGLCKMGDTSAAVRWLRKMEDVDEFSASTVIAWLMHKLETLDLAHNSIIETLELLNLEIAMYEAQVTVELSSSTLKSVC